MISAEWFDTADDGGYASVGVRKVYGCWVWLLECGSAEGVGPVYVMLIDVRRCCYVWMLR